MSPLVELPSARAASGDGGASLRRWCALSAPKFASFNASLKDNRVTFCCNDLPHPITIS